MSNLLDRIIGAVSPERGEARARARLRISALQQARAQYDGATHGRRAQGWRRTNKDANHELMGAAQVLAATARDMVRNNPYAERAVSAIATDIVGTGITFEVHRNGKPDAELTALAKEHLESTRCDADGRNNFYGLQLLTARTVVESGACLARLRPRYVSDGLPVPFQIQLLEPDYLDTQRNGLILGGAYVAGIELDQLGDRRRYWLFPQHPGAIASQGMIANPIPARDVLHVYRVDRPGQQHGASWFAPVILAMRDFADYQDAQLMRQKVAASFAVFITDPDGDGTSDDDPLEYVEPGIVEHLAGGKDVKFADPPGVDGYADFAKIGIRTFATGLNLPYDIFGDLSDSNFSQARIGRIQYHRQLDAWTWQMLIPQLCDGVGAWFLRCAQMIGKDVSGCSFVWTPPRREMLDIATEGPAIRDMVRAGLMSPSAAIRERGENPEAVFAEWERDAQRFDQLGLTLDCDPRKVTQVGNLVQPVVAKALPDTERSKGR